MVYGKGRLLPRTVPNGITLYPLTGSPQHLHLPECFVDNAHRRAEATHREPLINAVGRRPELFGEEDGTEAIGGHPMAPEEPRVGAADGHRGSDDSFWIDLACGILNRHEKRIIGRRYGGRFSGLDNLDLNCGVGDRLPQLSQEPILRGVGQ